MVERARARLDAFCRLVPATCSAPALPAASNFSPLLLAAAPLLWPPDASSPGLDAVHAFPPWRLTCGHRVASRFGSSRGSHLLLMASVLGASLPG